MHFKTIQMKDKPSIPKSWQCMKKMPFEKVHRYEGNASSNSSEWIRMIDYNTTTTTTIERLRKKELIQYKKNIGTNYNNVLCA